VLAFTPEVQTALDWFDLTHQIVSDFGRVYWTRSALPAAGGVGDQDAWLMQALECVLWLKDAVLAEGSNRAKNERAIADWRKSRGSKRA
jgi:hypothetical protein